MKDVRVQVQSRYGRVAEQGGCCGPESGSSCCGSTPELDQINGYSTDELAAAPDGANLGLGCGNPTALGEIKVGDTVLDLGSGAGFDCFLAARKTGSSGTVIGVDMTPQMLDRARANAERAGLSHVEFREGYIEELPVEDSSVDVVISNCVINLSIDKPQVFREIARVLKPGGRIFVSDLVLTRQLPWFLRRSAALYAACVAGAIPRDAYIAAMLEAGLEHVTVMSERKHSLELLATDGTMSGIVRLARWVPAVRRQVESVVSLSLRASKPA